MTNRILIVDDSRLSRMILIKYLQTYKPDWTFVEATSGEAAIELARESVFDAISMDINMSGITGLLAAEAILKESPNNKIVILSANIQQSIQQQTQDIGVDFLSKPITEKTAEHIIKLVEG